MVTSTKATKILAIVIMATVGMATAQAGNSDWEAIYDQRFDLINDGLGRSDTQFLAAMQTQDQLGDMDWQKTLYEDAQVLGPLAYDENMRLVQDIKERLL